MRWNACKRRLSSYGNRTWEADAANESRDALYVLGGVSLAGMVQAAAPDLQRYLKLKAM